MQTVNPHPNWYGLNIDVKPKKVNNFAEISFKEKIKISKINLAYF